MCEIAVLFSLSRCCTTYLFRIHWYSGAGYHLSLAGILAEAWHVKTIRNRKGVWFRTPNLYICICTPYTAGIKTASDMAMVLGGTHTSLLWVGVFFFGSLLFGFGLRLRYARNKNLILYKWRVVRCGIAIHFLTSVWNDLQKASINREWGWKCENALEKTASFEA